MNMHIYVVFATVLVVFGCATQDAIHSEVVTVQISPGSIEFDIAKRVFYEETKLPKGLSGDDQIRYAVLKHLISEQDTVKTHALFISIDDGQDPSPELMRALLDLKTHRPLLKYSTCVMTGAGGFAEPISGKRAKILHVGRLEKTTDGSGLVDLESGISEGNLSASGMGLRVLRTDDKVTVYWTGRISIS
jgi:hypothetical protein